MKTRFIRFFHGLAVCVLALLAQNAQSQVEVYNNGSTFNGNYNFTNGETGNEVVLATNANSYYITQAAIQFDLVNSGTNPLTGNPTGSEAVALNFYQNNGGEFLGPGRPGNGIPPSQESPGTLIWSSGFSTMATIGLTNFTQGLTLTYTPGVTVPQTFTWTLVFSNVPPEESAGLSLYSVPTAGESIPDAWVIPGTGAGAWDLIVLTSDDAALQFGAALQTFSEPQPGVFQSIAEISNGTVQIGLAGTTGATYTLNASTNLVTWTPLVTFTNFNGPLLYNDSTASNFPARFYTLTGQPTISGSPSSTPSLSSPFAPLPTNVSVYGPSQTTPLSSGMSP
jgi:hypothetical protein